MGIVTPQVDYGPLYRALNMRQNALEAQYLPKQLELQQKGLDLQQKQINLGLAKTVGGAALEIGQMALGYWEAAQLEQAKTEVVASRAKWREKFREAILNGDAQIVEAQEPTTADTPSREAEYATGNDATNMRWDEATGGFVTEADDAGSRQVNQGGRGTKARGFSTGTGKFTVKINDEAFDKALEEELAEVDKKYGSAFHKLTGINSKMKEWVKQGYIAEREQAMETFYQKAAEDYKAALLTNIDAAIKQDATLSKDGKPSYQMVDTVVDTAMGLSAERKAAIKAEAHAKVDAAYAQMRYDADEKIVREAVRSGGLAAAQEMLPAWRSSPDGKAHPEWEDKFRSAADDEYRRAKTEFTDTAGKLFDAARQADPLSSPADQIEKILRETVPPAYQEDIRAALTERQKQIATDSTRARYVAAGTKADLEALIKAVEGEGKTLYRGIGKQHQIDLDFLRERYASLYPGPDRDLAWSQAKEQRQTRAERELADLYFQYTQPGGPEESKFLQTGALYSRALQLQLDADADGFSIDLMPRVIEYRKELMKDLPAQQKEGFERVLKAVEFYAKTGALASYKPLDKDSKVGQQQLKDLTEYNTRISDLTKLAVDIVQSMGQTPDYEQLEKRLAKVSGMIYGLGAESLEKVRGAMQTIRDEERWDIAANIQSKVSDGSLDDAVFLGDGETEWSYVGDAGKQLQFLYARQAKAIAAVTGLAEKDITAAGKQLIGTDGDPKADREYRFGDVSYRTVANMDGKGLVVERKGGAGFEWVPIGVESKDASEVRAREAWEKEQAEKREKAIRDEQEQAARRSGADLRLEDWYRTPAGAWANATTNALASGEISKALDELEKKPKPKSVLEQRRGGN